MGVAAISSRAPQRSAGAKKRLRTDRDGDISMDAPSAPRGGISKRGRGSGRGAGRGTAAPGRSILDTRAQQRILREAAEGNIPRGPRSGARQQDRRNLKELKVTGWEKSKAASTSNDRGISSLTAFLERKAAQKKGSEVKIKRSRVTGNVCFIYASDADVTEILKLNSFTFAGVQLTIEETDGSSSTTDASASADTKAVSPETADLKELLKGVLQRRYTAAHKLLDLSALAQDEALVSLGIFQNPTAESRFFMALMKICDAQFETAQQKTETIEAVVLSNNGLKDLKLVTSLAATLPHIKNLDLSNNQFADLKALQNWRHKFRQLDHLIVSGNPLEHNVPDFNVELMKWYPTLRMLNGIQVRSDAEIATAGQKGVKNPPPVLAPIFKDEAQIAENFLRTFFQGYDADRNVLAQMYYGPNSTFSYSVNTHALRDPQATEQDKPHAGEWEAHIKGSRNLKKINHTRARMARLYRGPQAVAEAFKSLPATQHPSIDVNPEKWIFECRSHPGLPDPSGQSPQGVNGFKIDVHGEFFEMVNGQQKHRSFDRTFLLGPGLPGGNIVCLISDILVIRAYGGHAAFVPESADAPAQQIPTQDAAIPDQEAMVAQLSQVTRLQPHLAKQCLSETNWNMDAAMAAFETAKPNLGSECFL